jgi:hypothetical protein
MDESQAAQLAADRGSGSRDELSEVYVGLNRRTWRVGERLWLSSIDSERSDLFDRENLLPHSVHSACRDAGLRAQVPKPIATRTGSDLVQVGSWSFRATAHLVGSRPDDSSLATYRAASSLLRELHAVLLTLPTELAVAPHIVSNVRELVERVGAPVSQPQTTNSTEQAVVSEAAAWLEPPLCLLDSLPAQLVRWDWSTPNLLIDDTACELVGVLDWQLCSSRTSNLRHRERRLGSPDVVAPRDRSGCRHRIFRVRRSSRASLARSCDGGVLVPQLLVATKRSSTHDALGRQPGRIHEVLTFARRLE